MAAFVISPAGVKAVKHDEGLRLEAYVDPVGIVTIGYGHTGTLHAFSGNKITRQKADELLRGDLEIAEDIINKWVKVPLTQPQVDALVSFVMNVGPGGKTKDGFVWLKSGRHSTMLRKLNAGDYLGAADEFPKWKHGGGKPLPGLVKRRARERALFLSGTVTEDDEDLGSNVEAELPQKPSVASSKPVQALAATGTAGTLSVAAESVAPLAEYSEYLKILWIVLVLSGIGYFIYTQRKED